MKKNRRPQAFTLPEMMIALMSSTIILGALFLSSSQLQRALFASEQYGLSQTDQRRLLDYLARDVRRAVSIGTATSVNGAGAVPLTGNGALVENPTALVLTMPGYYQTDTPDASGYTDALPVVVANNYVDYGNSQGHAPGVQVMYRKQFMYAEGCQCFVRQEASSEVIIVHHADNMHLQLNVSADGRSGVISVNFTPAGSRTAPLTTAHDHILLRNTRTD